MQRLGALAVPAPEFQSPICRGRRCNLGLAAGSSCRSMVSVPYLSGQALQCDGRPLSAAEWLFQSPICRGRRCNTRAHLGFPFPDEFQSPIRRGRRCNAEARRARRAGTGVSVPYLSGQALQSRA